MTLCEQSSVPIQHIEADFSKDVNISASIPFFQDAGVDPVFIRKLMQTWDILNWNRDNLYCGTRFTTQQDYQILADLELRLKNMKKVIEAGV